MNFTSKHVFKNSTCYSELQTESNINNKNSYENALF